jgi:hypothetical protein
VSTPGRAAAVVASGMTRPVDHMDWPAVSGPAGPLASATPSVAPRSPGGRSLASAEEAICSNLFSLSIMCLKLLA